jgi:hypothetical protein
MARTLFLALATLTVLLGTQMTLTTSYQTAGAVETDRHPCPDDAQRHPCPKPTKTPPPAHTVVAPVADTDRHPCPDDAQRHPCPKPTKTPKP